MSLDIYTTHLMEDAVIDSATSEATGYPKENMNDFNPDTYWKATGTADFSIDIDLQTALQVDAYAIWIHNYTTEWSSAANAVDIILLSSPDDTTYTTRNSVELTPTLTQPLWVRTLSSSQTFRYWRLTISGGGGLTAIPEVSAFWLLRKYSISQAHQYPNNDRIIYRNRQSMAPNGRRWVSSINKASTLDMTRTYALSGTTNYNALANAFNASRGRMFPVILEENSAYTPANFAEDSLAPMEVDYQVYRPSVKFVSIPYVRPGEVY